MKNSPAMKYIVSLEHLIFAVLIAIFFVVVGGFAWYWLIILFFVVDISMVGYLINPRIGAATYNIGHSLVGPGILAILYILSTNQALLFATLIWLFHIAVDRTLGYGLKHTTSFEHTHLGPIGKSKHKV